MNDEPVHEQLAEDRTHYLAHPDVDEWEDSPAPASTGAKREVGTMISVRLSASEADEIRAAADAAGLAVSAFVRTSVLEKIRRGSPSVASAGFIVGNFSRTVGYVEVQAGAPVSGGVRSSSVSTV
jgi:Family of unknown function (DUF6290)